MEGEIREWHQRVIAGTKELVLSLEDSHIENFTMMMLNYFYDFPKWLLVRPLEELATTVNLARDEKRLPHITFCF